MIRDTATGILGSMAVGDRYPAEVVETTLMRMKHWQPITNAFSAMFEEDARRDVGRIELATGRGQPAGALYGVPVVVKDLFDVEGHDTTGASAAYEGNRAVRDARVVGRLRAAGAIIIGKTNQHELAMGGTNLLSTFGPTHNPWDPTRITGGSSGGSAAAVACAAVPLALGTDTGGSIRNPSNMCGLWGLKPTHGRLPLDGVMPLAPSLDCPGPMAGTIEDLELLWRVMSQTDEAGTFPSRIGMLSGFFASHLHPDIREALGWLVRLLRDLGVGMVEVDGDGGEPIWDAWGDFVCMELVKAHPKLEYQRDDLFERTAGLVSRGLNLTEDEQVELRGRPDAAREWFDRRLDGVDMLLAPSAPYPAPRPEDEEVDVGGGQSVDVHTGGTSRFTRLVNLAGLPAIAIPVGLSPAGLPIGVQVIGRRGADEALLRLGRELSLADERFRPDVPPYPVGGGAWDEG